MPIHHICLIKDLVKNNTKLITIQAMLHVSFNYGNVSHMVSILLNLPDTNQNIVEHHGIRIAFKLTDLVAIGNSELTEMQQQRVKGWFKIII
jgi:hypothetical protein